MIAPGKPATGNGAGRHRVGIAPPNERYSARNTQGIDQMV